MAAKIETLKQGDNRFTVDKSIDMSIPKVTRQQASAMMNVGVATTGRASRVLKHGTPELVKAVEDGKVSVNAAAQVANAPREEQLQVIDQPRRKQPAKPDSLPEDRKLKGKGVFLANEAINCLMRIPRNDPLRERGYQIVMDWITLSRKGMTDGRPKNQKTKDSRHSAVLESLPPPVGGGLDEAILSTAEVVA